jgi:hypothetical protein
MQFGKLPKDVMQVPVSMGAKVLYAALAMYRNGRTLQCNPSQAQLAATIGVSKDRVTDLAKELDRAGLIKRDVIPGRQTCYILPHLSADFEPTPPGEYTYTPPVNTPTPEDQGVGEHTYTPPVNTPTPSRGIHLHPLIKVSEQTIEQTNKQTNKQTSLKRGKRSEPATPYQPSPESLKALEIWEACAPLPQTANRLGCLKVLDDLHRTDGLTWDRIHHICRHAAREWVPQQFIASPAKLRKPIRSGELKTWEAIERQLKGSAPARSAPLKIMPARSW